MTWIPRRSFLAGLASLGASMLSRGARISHASAAEGEIPKRVLGKTGVEVPILGLGGAPMGHAFIGKDKAVPLIHEAIDLGVTYIDTARVYDDCEMYLGEVMPTRRDEVFLVEKVWASTREEAEKSFTASLKNLKTDHVDLLHIHNVGAQDVEKVMGKGGSMEYVLEMKEKGLARFVGITGHSSGAKFLPAIETGEFDVFMTNLNFVDRQTYNFQERVLPAARRQNMGIVAMKVFGGRQQTNYRGFQNYSKPGPANMPPERLHDALRYCLGLDGVSLAVAGVYNREELRQNVAWAKSYQPMTPAEIQEIEALGKQMAGTWGEHFGAV